MVSDSRLTYQEAPQRDRGHLSRSGDARRTQFSAADRAIVTRCRGHDTPPRSVRTAAQKLVLPLPRLGDQRFKRLALPGLDHLIALSRPQDVA